MYNQRWWVYLLLCKGPFILILSIWSQFCGHSIKLIQAWSIHLIFCTGCLMTKLHVRPTQHHIRCHFHPIFVSKTSFTNECTLIYTISTWSTVEFEIKWTKGVWMHLNYSVHSVIYHAFFKIIFPNFWLILVLHLRHYAQLTVSLA